MVLLFGAKTVRKLCYKNNLCGIYFCDSDRKTSKRCICCTRFVNIMFTKHHRNVNHRENRTCYYDG